MMLFHECRARRHAYRASGRTARGARHGRMVRDALLVAAGIYAGQAGAFQAEGTVRIGSLEAQTGVPAPYGIQALTGAQIAIDEINGGGGVMVDGKAVKLVLTPAPNGYDPGGDSATTIALLKKVVSDDQVLAIKGTSRSDNTEAAFNYLNELERQGTPVALMSSASASPGLGKISKWGFRNAFFDGELVARETQILHDTLGYKTAGLFVAKDNAFNVAVAKGVLIPNLQKAGFEIVVQTEGLEKDTDFSAQIEALARAKPDVVVVSTPVLPGVNLMKEAQRRGFKPKIWIGTIGNIAPEVPKLGGKAVERMVVGSSYSPDLPRIERLAAEYRKRAGSDINLFGVNGYEAIYLFKSAIEGSGIKNTPGTLNEDRRKFRDALANVSIDSVTGERVRFNAENDAVKKGYFLTIRNGKYTVWDEKPLP
jgi:branched-chain amino acid transport system substrate-binding protein